MNILMLCSRFPLEPGNEYLTNELASALALDGHAVSVVVIDWDATPGSPTRELTMPDGVWVLALPPTSVRGLGSLVEKASKWLLSPLLAARTMHKHLRGRSFDALICFSPATTAASQILWAKWKHAPRSYLVQWDFFPFHQRGIGLIRNRIAFTAARLIEQAMIRRFDVIGCMSPMNISYLRRNYRLRPQQRVELLPIWGNITSPQPEPAREARARYGLPADKRIVIFGGQLTEGRGVEEILAAADLARETRPDIVFLMIGQGRQAALVQAHVARGASNVIYRNRIPRVDYLRLAAACDVGLIATVRNVDVPTFPSKIIDYLRAGLPVVASVEASTDYGGFIEERGLGTAAEAGDPAALLRAVETLLDQPTVKQAAKEAAQRCLAETFDVAHAARNIGASLREL